MATLCAPLLTLRNVFSHVPKGMVGDVVLKAIHAQEDRGSAQDKIREVIIKLKAMRLMKAAAGRSQGTRNV